MAYTPTTWNTGDTITAAAMNKIENGIANAGGGGVLIVEYDGSELDKTWNELKASMDAGVIPMIVDYFDDSPEYIYRYCMLQSLSYNGSLYIALFSCTDSGNDTYSLGFVSSSATGTLVYD